MKLLVSSVVLIASLSVFAQNQPAVSDRYEMFRTRAGFRVVWDDGRVLEVKATSLERVKESPGVRFKGDVEIAIDGMQLQADEMECHFDTGEFEPFGNVHLKALRVFH